MKLPSIPQYRQFRARTVRYRPLVRIGVLLGTAALLSGLSGCATHERRWDPVITDGKAIILPHNCEPFSHTRGY